jgi:hypothetical protein
LCFVFTAKARYRAAATVRANKLDVIGAVLFRDDVKGDSCHVDNIINGGFRESFRSWGSGKASGDGENAEVLTAA